MYRLHSIKAAKIISFCHFRLSGSCSLWVSSIFRVETLAFSLLSVYHHTAMPHSLNACDHVSCVSVRTALHYTAVRHSSRSISPFVVFKDPCRRLDGVVLGRGVLAIIIHGHCRVMVVENHPLPLAIFYLLCFCLTSLSTSISFFLSHGTHTAVPYTHHLPSFGYCILMFPALLSSQ